MRRPVRLGDNRMGLARLVCMLSELLSRLFMVKDRIT